MQLFTCHRQDSANTDRDDGNEGNEGDEGDEGNEGDYSLVDADYYSDYAYFEGDYGNVGDYVGDYVDEASNGVSDVDNEGGQRSNGGGSAEMGYFREYADGTTLEDGPDILVLYDTALAVLDDYADYGRYAAEA